MTQNFPPRGIRYHFNVWRDRRRYPWRYPEPEKRRGRRAPQSSRRRFFVVRSIDNGGRHDPHIFAECPSYAVAMEVAALGDDRVFTEGQMLDHPERLRVLAAWDINEGRRRSRGPKPAASRGRDPSHMPARIEAFDG